MLLAAAATLALGLALLVLGLRGRRVDDHPICRKCNFDLIGLPTKPERERAGCALPAESVPPRCPECGSDLSTPRATRIGARRRRPLAITLGLLLALSGLSLSTALIWARAAKYDWNKSKPAWLLLREADSRRSDQRILLELWGRLRDQRLSPFQARQIIDRAITVQSDPSLPWNATWGNIIEAGRDLGAVSDEEWGRYLRLAVGPLCPSDRNPLSRQDGQLFLSLAMRMGTSRAGAAQNLLVRYHLDHLTAGGLDIDLAPIGAGPAFDHGPSTPLGSSGSLSLPALPIPDHTGAILVQSVWTITIAEGRPSEPLARSSPCTSSSNPLGTRQLPQGTRAHQQAPDRPVFLTKPRGRTFTSPGCFSGLARL